MHDECWVNSSLALRTAVQPVFHLNRVNSSYSHLNTEGVFDPAATISVLRIEDNGKIEKNIVCGFLHSLMNTYYN